MTFTPWNWYWVMANGQIYSSKSNSLVTDSDTGYKTFKLAGNYPTHWPLDNNGQQTNNALNAVLTANNLPAFNPAPVASTTPSTTE